MKIIFNIIFKVLTIIYRKRILFLKNICNQVFFSQPILQLIEKEKKKVASNN
jgi:hypothetical protein